MLRAIRTKYLGATNHRGSRVKAQLIGYNDAQSRKTVYWDHSINVVANHAAAAAALAKQVGWDWPADTKCIEDFDGYIFVASR